MTGTTHPLFPHQIENIEAGLEHAKLALWDVPGAGKTRSAIHIAMANKCEFCMIIVPTTAVYAIAEEIEKFAPGHWDVKVCRTKHQLPKMQPDVATFIVVPWSILSIESAADQLRSLTYDLVVADEVHFGKSSDSKRGGALWGTDRKPFAGIMDCAERGVIMSGTPIPNGRASEMYGFARWMGDIPKGLSLWDHKRQNGHMVRINIGRRAVWKEKGARPEFLAKVRDRHAAKGDYKRIGKEALNATAGLKPRRWKLVPQHPTPAFLKEYRAAMVAAAEDDKDVDAWPTVRRMVGVAKVNAAVEYISDLLESGAEKVLVFAQHHDVIDGLERALSKDYGHVPVLDGRSVENTRKQFSTRFNNNPDVRVAVGQIMAAGTAITLHANGACTDVVFVEGSPVPGELAQAADRIHRIGQPNACIAHLMVMQSTIEDQILRTVMAKLDDIETLIGDKALELT